MKRIALLLSVVFAFTFACASCKKKEPPPVAPPVAPPGAGMPGQPGTPQGMMGGAPEKKIVVPDAVKSAWKAVKIEVEYKKTKTKKTFTVPLNSEFKIPESDMTLKLGAYLPHFAMSADSITDNPGSPENPAVGADILQGGKIVFHGWLFSKYPDIHPFQSDAIGVRLLDGVKK